jgi:hypothetical protein
MVAVVVAELVHTVLVPEMALAEAEQPPLVMWQLVEVVEVVEEMVLIIMVANMAEEAVKYRPMPDGRVVVVVVDLHT